MLLGWTMARAAMHEDVGALTELESTRVHFRGDAAGLATAVVGDRRCSGCQQQKRNKTIQLRHRCMALT